MSAMAAAVNEAWVSYMLQVEPRNGRFVGWERARVTSGTWKGRPLSKRDPGPESADKKTIRQDTEHKNTPSH